MKLQAQTFCEAFWRGETRRFAVALSEGFIHFWEPNSSEFQSAPQDWVWVVEGRVLAGHQERIVPALAKVNADFLVVTFRGAIENRRVGRRLVHHGKSLYLGFYGIGSLLFSGANHASFSFSSKEELWTQGEPFWHKSIERWLGEEGDFSFAWKWTGLSDNVRAQYLTELCAGNWDELQMVCEWILAFDSQDEVAQASAPDTLIAHLTCFNGEYSIFVQTEDDEIDSRRLDLWNEWLRFFNPVFRYDIAEKHLAADSFSRHAFAWTHFIPVVVLTHHEQLETRLLLRDWLRERVGLDDERIAQLLN